MLSVEVAFRGSAADKELASKIFNALNMHGRFMAYDAPIALELTKLTELLALMGTEAADAAIQTAAKKNDAIFAITKNDEGVVWV